ncbi:MAG TPA: hypothetical protein VF006_29600 [Longimicrobium sp.]
MYTERGGGVTDCTLTFCRTIVGELPVALCTQAPQVHHLDAVDLPVVHQPADGERVVSAIIRQAKVFEFVLDPATGATIFARGGRR